MKTEIIGKPEVIMSNKNSKHNYFAWPTVARLKDGTIAVGASGFRFFHVCPFGKAVISYSRDGGKTYSLPAPVIDTPLDDRDAGICPFGKSGVIFTSFNNTADMQRENSDGNKYVDAYINSITKEDENKYLGSTFRISKDNGITFGEIMHSPISCPHGPTELRDGTILWAGTDFYDVKGGIQIRKLNTESGETELISSFNLENEDVYLNEPHLIELADGRLICHIRAENDVKFTMYQSVSDDKGKTWTYPERILDETGGAPPHLFMHSSGILISTYGRRKMPYGIMAMLSTDNGKTWIKDIRLYENKITDDIGYPSTVELEDGSLLTVFYASEFEDEHCEIMQVKWRIILSDN